MLPAAFQKQFVTAGDLPWEPVTEGVRRKILTYDDNLMMVLVDFDAGGVGSPHRHPHTQMSYVQSGRFLITIDGAERLLSAGDAFYVPPHVLHGAVCREAGTLVDLFTPMRADFVSPETTGTN